MQGEGAVGQPGPYRATRFAFNCFQTRKLHPLRLDHSRVRQKTIEITKLDVALGNAITRGKTLGLVTLVLGLIYV